VRSPRTTAVETFIERAKADAESRRMENQERAAATASNAEGAVIAVATSPASDAVATITRPYITQLTKEATIDVTGRIHSGESTSFHFVAFETHNTGAGSKGKSSDSFKPYLILCAISPGGCPTRSTSRDKGGRRSVPGGLAKVLFPVTKAGEIIVCLSLVPLYALTRPPARIVENLKGKVKTLCALSVSVDKMIGHQIGLPRSLP
jgi:hypothetical protein